MRRMESLLAKPLTWLVFGLSSKPTFLLAAGLAQALGMAAGIINAFGLVAVLGALLVRVSQRSVSAMWEA